MRKRIEKHFEPCYITRKNEEEIIFGVNLVSYDERANIAKKKKENKQSKEKKEKYFSYRLFGEIHYLPMSKKTENLKPFIVQENLDLPSMTVKCCELLSKL